MQFIIKSKNFKTGQSIIIGNYDSINGAMSRLINEELKRRDYNSVLYVEDSQGNKAYSDATGSLFKVFPNLMYQLSMETLKRVKSRAQTTCHSSALIHKRINKVISEKVVFNVG